MSTDVHVTKFVTICGMVLFLSWTITTGLNLWHGLVRPMAIFCICLLSCYYLRSLEKMGKCPQIYMSRNMPQFNAIKMVTAAVSAIGGAHKGSYVIHTSR